MGNNNNKNKRDGDKRQDKRDKIINYETRETVFLFQRLSIALQRGNAVAFLSTFDTE